MIKINAYVWIDKKRVDISDIIASLTISGEYRACARSCNFGVAIGENIPKIKISVGNHFEVYENNKCLFYGVIWDKNQVSDQNEISFVAKDFGIYLLKNKENYNFVNMAAEEIVSKVANDYKISKGDIAVTKVKQNLIFLGKNLYEIIMTAYSKANDKNYVLLFDREKLCIYEKGVVFANSIKKGQGLISLSASESLKNMVNAVGVYTNESITAFANYREEENIKVFGLMKEMLMVGKDDTNFSLKVKKKLCGIERKVSVSNIGDVSFLTGKCCVVRDDNTGIYGKFYIDGDEHNFKNGIYQNKLVLNFQNVMDEKEANKIVKGG